MNITYEIEKVKGDMIDQSNYEQCIDDVCSILNKIPDHKKLEFCRDFELKNIRKILDKFPNQQQIEILAILSHEYLQKKSM